jgi:hypothetical protein
VWIGERRNEFLGVAGDGLIGPLCAGGPAPLLGGEVDEPVVVAGRRGDGSPARGSSGAGLCGGSALLPAPDGHAPGTLLIGGPTAAFGRWV